MALRCFLFRTPLPVPMDLPRSREIGLPLGIVVSAAVTGAQSCRCLSSFQFIVSLFLYLESRLLSLAHPEPQSIPCGLQLRSVCLPGKPHTPLTRTRPQPSLLPLSVVCVEVEQGELGGDYTQRKSREWLVTDLGRQQKLIALGIFR